MLRGADHRLTSLNALLQEKLQDKFMNTFSTTQFDWTRSRGACIYFNDSQVFQNEEITKAEVENFFKTLETVLHSDLLNYIKNYGGQAGFLNVTEEFTKSEILNNKNINLINNGERYDFIINNSKSITFMERFYIENYQDATTFKKAQDGNDPIACCVTVSKIELSQNTIHHKIIDNTIYVLNEKLGAVLFNDISFKESYEKSFAEIEKILNAEVNFLVAAANNKKTTKSKKLSSSDEDNFFNDNLHIGYVTESQQDSDIESAGPNEESTPKIAIAKKPSSKNPNYKKHVGLMAATWTIAGGLLSAALQVYLEFPIPGLTGVWVPVVAGAIGAGAGLILGSATGFATTTLIKHGCRDSTTPEYTIVNTESEPEVRKTKKLSQVKIRQDLGILESSQSDEDIPTQKPATDASKPTNIPSRMDVPTVTEELSTPLYFRNSSN